MVRGMYKSNTLRRVEKKNVKHHKTVYKKRKPEPAKCAICGAELKGVPRERPFKMQTMAKTKKRPERKYGGYLCASCARKKIIEEARK